MTKLLVIETSPRGERSVSRAMTSRFISTWQVAHPHGTVMRRDLADAPPGFIDAEWLQAYFTPQPQQTAEMRETLRLSDALVAELLDADHLVIATPVYNYNVPAALKSWVDHIVRKGITLGFDGAPLVHGKRATLLIASGASYGADSPIRERDIATRWLQLVLGIIGIADVSVVAGGGAKAVDLGAMTMAAFVDAHEADVVKAAQ
ncbi:FMN-dependent NADH-azoreductase [Massilia sp. CF038]|uniref:FMN-dependent NADH-azoreductase n=1 Tax=Massilia sp. CF038 TaxID=1881045 RepID=UPI00091C024D|nr:NAD(P)H-dependent oxidoreductase [Massilia sp. CF038]SHG70757.1 FMN-dependent NADH-azoreductase [Massilia sp. CF038]